MSDTIAIRIGSDGRIRTRYFSDAPDPVTWIVTNPADWPDADPGDGEAYYYDKETGTVEIRTVEK